MSNSEFVGDALAYGRAAGLAFSHDFLTNGIKAVRPQDFGVITPGEDCYDAIADAVAYAKANGRPLLFPRIGGAGYYTRQTIVLDYDNATVYLDDDVTLTKTNPADLVGPDAAYQSGVNGCGVIAFLFSGILQGPRTKSYIKKPQLIGLRKVTINGNGAAASSSYTYVVGAAGTHAPVAFRGTIDGRIEGVRAYNGLVFCVDTSYSPNIFIDRVTAETTQYDNGIQVNSNQEHIATYSDTDPLTWANATIRDCVGITCRNHGIGSYGAVGVNIINPTVINCGNNGPARTSGGLISDAGPAGGINAEHDGTNTSRDYRVNIINPRVYNSWGFGLRTNCKGTRVVGGFVSGTKMPTDATYVAADTGNLWGSAIFSQGAATLELVGTDVETSDKYGVRMAVASGLYPSVYITGGRFTGCAKRVIFGQGIANLIISPETVFVSNGNASDTTAGDQYCVDLSNSADNTGAGLAQIAGRFDTNYGGIAKVARLGGLDLTKGISGKDNGAAWASAYFMIYVPDRSEFVYAANINLENSNGKCARIAQVGVADRAMVSRESIIGSQTSTVREPFEIVTVATSFLGSGPSNVVFPGYTATFTPNSANGNPIFSSLTGNMTIAANSTGVPVIDGQTITFTFIQDATGGRSITWNAAWKGATLTGSGTASQRAVVTFRYSGATWVQISSSGWVS